MRLIKCIIPIFIYLNAACQTAKNLLPDAPTGYPKDSVAERMLIYQRQNGGWPQPDGNAINYNLTLSESAKNKLKTEKNNLDACIDDQSTTREIKTLVASFKNTKNPDYLKAAENGIKYLLSAQNSAGGWGQFFPDTSSYRKHITFNDNAMIDVMWVLKFATEQTNDFGSIDKALLPEIKNVLEKGIHCILKTQYIQNGRLTAWCAQHDRISLQPAKARAFELASLSGSETVGVCYFLMSISHPSSAIRKSLEAAIAWLESVKIEGIKIQDVADPSQPSGKDRVIMPDPNSTLWARFYDLQTNKPFFTGRNSLPKPSLAEIENERRVGYAFYGTWPKKLINADYPLWKQKWSK